MATKLKIVDRALAGYTGWFGKVFFKDGVSEGEVSDIEANIVTSLVRCEVVEGDYRSPSQKLVDVTHAVAAPAEKFDRGMTADEIAKDRQARGQENEPLPGKAWEAEELIAIADKQGIAGLREIAGPLGIKGRSIPELIKAIQETGN